MFNGLLTVTSGGCLDKLQCEHLHVASVYKQRMLKLMGSLSWAVNCARCIFSKHGFIWLLRIDVTINNTALYESHRGKRMAYASSWTFHLILLSVICIYCSPAVSLISSVHVIGGLPICIGMVCIVLLFRSISHFLARPHILHIYISCEVYFNSIRNLCVYSDPFIGFPTSPCNA